MESLVHTAGTLAAINKHHVAGIVGIVLGLIIIVIGAMRVAAHVAGALIVPILGGIVVIGGILLFTHAV